MTRKVSSSCHSDEMIWEHGLTERRKYYYCSCTEQHACRCGLLAIAVWFKLFEFPGYLRINVELDSGYKEELLGRTTVSYLKQRTDSGHRRCTNYITDSARLAPMMLTLSWGYMIECFIFRSLWLLHNSKYWQEKSRTIWFSLMQSKLEYISP